MTVRFPFEASNANASSEIKSVIRLVHLTVRLRATTRANAREDDDETRSREDDGFDARGRD